MYPYAAESVDAKLRTDKLDRHIPEIEASHPQAKVFKVLDDKRWTHDLYRDDVHPGAKGTEVLASIIQTVLCSAPIDKMNCR